MIAASKWWLHLNLKSGTLDKLQDVTPSSQAGDGAHQIICQLWCVWWWVGVDSSYKVWTWYLQCPSCLDWLVNIKLISSTLDNLCGGGCHVSQCCCDHDAHPTTHLPVVWSTLSNTLLMCTYAIQNDLCTCQHPHYQMTFAHNSIHTIKWPLYITA